MNNKKKNNVVIYPCENVKYLDCIDSKSYNSGACLIVPVSIHNVCENEHLLVIVEVYKDNKFYSRQIKEVYPEGVFIFVLPPSLEELKSRIVGRGTETQEEIEKRFSCAFEEINQIVNYDYFIVNEDIEKSVSDVEAIICAEKNKVTRYKNNIIDKFKEEL